MINKLNVLYKANILFSIDIKEGGAIFVAISDSTSTIHSTSTSFTVYADSFDNLDHAIDSLYKIAKQRFPERLNDEE